MSAHACVCVSVWAQERVCMLMFDCSLASAPQLCLCVCVCVHVNVCLTARLQVPHSCVLCVVYMCIEEMKAKQVMAKL